MVMDSRYTDFSDVLYDFEFGGEIVLPGFDSPPNLANGRQPSDEIILPGFNSTPNVANGFISDEIVSPSLNSTPSVADGFKFRDELDFGFLDIPNDQVEPGFATTISQTGSSELYSPDDSELSDGVLKFLDQILMEEKIDEKPSMFHDPLALQTAEKVFDEVLGRKDSPPPNGPVDIYQGVESPNDYFPRSPSEDSTSSAGTSSGNYYEPPQSVADSEGPKSSNVQNQPQQDFSWNSNLGSRSQWSVIPENSRGNDINGVMNSPVRSQVVTNIFSDSESILQFKKGMEEANKFLPNIAEMLVNSDNYALSINTKEGPPVVQVKIEKDEEISPSSSRRRKHYLRQDSVIEDERSSKHSAVFEEEVELSEMFDKVLLYEPGCDKEEPIEWTPVSLDESGLTLGSNGSRSTFTIAESDSEAVDLRNLLISCAQSVASEDRKTAYQQLKLIRQHASASGDASQRLAFIFANGLEARMAGTGTQSYAALSSRRKISATEKLKAYQAYLSACPFKKTSVLFSNKMILEKASNATTLHIIDFGIQYGFQWPVLIQLLSKRPGGPPKLRITGIELPQPGFRPAEHMEATGHRLRSYCKRFNVSFEYNPIASQKWETITMEDLKVEKNEVVAVNCFLRFENLLDETVTVNNPRDAVLKLIRKVNPAIFVQAIVNGSYSAPFFVTRFREALYHYSSFLDLLDTSIPRDNQQRLNFEREFCGREVMNVIACEGAERVERPETYKQWQFRNTRAGFKLHPLNKELVKKLKHKVKLDFHKDFVFDEDCEWILVGWKGRILHAVSAWEPA